jgi:hypothetical protein
LAPDLAAIAASPTAPEESTVNPVIRGEPDDPEELLVRLERNLEYTDLLVLDDLDMSGLRKRPDVAALVRQYVAAGGTLFAFVSENGDYAEIVGAPFVTLKGAKETDRFILAQGEVSELSLQTAKKLKVKEERVLPELQEPPRNSLWKVAAFDKGRKAPRILQRMGDQQSGCVVVWLDSPISFRGPKGGTVQGIEAVRAKLEDYVLKQARSLLERRFGGADQRTQAVTGH